MIDYTANSRRLIRYLKESRGLKSFDIAYTMGCSKTRVYRVEKGLGNLSVEELSKLSMAFNFTGNPVADNFLLSSDIDTTKQFKFEPDWTSFSSSGFSVRGFINYFVNTFSYDAFEDFCRKHQVDHLYFYNLSNPGSIDFILKLIHELKLAGYLKTRYEVAKLAALTCNSSISFFKPIMNVKNVNLRSQLFIEQIPEFEQNHDYKLMDNSGLIDIKFKANKDRLDFHLWNDDSVISQFPVLWIENVIHNIFKDHYKGSSLIEKPHKKSDYYILRVT